MSSFDWESFLRQWSQAILESMKEAQLAQLPPEAIDSGWLGFPGATEQQICQTESRLGVKLPPSYRDFLKITNGWRQTTPFIRRLWSTEGIERFAARHQKWIDAFTNHHENADVSFEHSLELEQLWEPPTVPDEEYLIYGEEQDCSKIRVEYLKTAIEISDVGEDAIYLLNPQTVTEDGEWEAWFFADWLPGADRYRSFREMMEAEYQNFLDLRDTSLELSYSSIEIQETTISLEISNPAFDPPLELQAGISEASFIPPAQIDEGAELEVWRLLKRLTIEFQSRTEEEHTEYRTIASADESEPISWSGLGEPKLRQWLRQQLAEATPSNLATATIAPPATELADLAANLKLEIDQLKVWQESRLTVHIVPPRLNQKQERQGTIGSLTSQKPFSVEVAFNLVGQMLSQLDSTQPITYKAYFYAHDRHTGKRFTLGETEPASLRSGAFTCIAKLSETALEPGLYRLQVITALQGIAVTPAYFEIPMVQVM